MTSVHQGTIDYAVAEGIAHITLNRPDSKNAFTPELAEAFSDAVRHACEDKLARCVVVRAEGRHFSVGGDVSSVEQLQHSRRSQEILWTRANVEFASLMQSSGKPFIAAINGAAVGIGFSIACAADLRYAADDALLVSGYAPAALSGDGGVTWTLPRIVGGGIALELLLRSPRVDSAWALRIGLVNDVFPTTDLWSSVDEVAGTLADSSTQSLAHIKSNISDAWENRLSTHLDLETRRHVECKFSPDAAEAADAFLSKREPKFHK